MAVRTTTSIHLFIVVISKDHIQDDQNIAARLATIMFKFNSLKGTPIQKLRVVVKPMEKPRMILKYIRMDKNIRIALDQVIPGCWTIPLSTDSLQRMDQLKLPQLKFFKLTGSYEDLSVLGYYNQLTINTTSTQRIWI
ncbi:30S ribosomal protein 3, chloroplastic-like protein, partial [Tanacetum coccineum]